jgi:ABC-type transporter Mla subunit MlaD
MSQSQGPTSPGESARRTAETMSEATRETIESTSQLTRELIERNTELAMQVAPVVFEGYERALRTFASFYEQAGQQMGQVAQSMAQTPASVAESMSQAAQSLSQIPAQMGQSMAQAGQSMAEAGAAAGQVPQRSVGDTANLPQSVASLASAQAAFMRDVAETLHMARELIERPAAKSGAKGGAGSGKSSS